VHDTGQGPWTWLQAGLWPALPVSLKRALRPVARRMGSGIGLTGRPSWLRLPLERPGEPERPRGGLFAVEDLVRSLTGGLHNFFLEAGERAGAEALIEARHPLLDVRLTEFVLAIPEEQRRRGPILKFVLRKALERELPEILATRTTKGDFAHCVWDALEQLGGESFFRSLAIAEEGWVDGDRVRALYRRMQDDVPRGPDYYGRHIPELWMITAVEIWHRSAFGGIMAPAWTSTTGRPVAKT
jgi:asparagine synthetase B (glutamine-hydrolysing)